MTHNTPSPRPLVIVPARGGSKGIPGKNIKLFAGKPLVVRSLETGALFAPGENLILSTDSQEIAGVARKAGFNVPYMRPEALGGDTVGSREVMLDVMDWADSRGLRYDCVLLLQPTSPLRAEEDVRHTLEAWNQDIDMAVTVTEAACNPYYDCFETPDGFLRVSKGDGLITRRQDAPKAWQMNGAAYAITPASLRAMPMGKFARRVAVEMPRERSVDLDSPLDWIIAETIYDRLKYGNGL